MDGINYTTVTVPTTTEWAAWSEYESEYHRATKTSGVVGPIVGSVVVIIFVISIFCFTSHVRRRRQEILASTARRARGSNQGGRPFVIGHSHSPDWVDREADENDVNRIMQDLPPPYTPPYETEVKDGDLPPSYADAVVMYSYDNSGTDDVTRSYDENEVSSDDYDTDNRTDYSVDDDVYYDVTYDENVPYGANEIGNGDPDNDSPGDQDCEVSS
ncbi:uncharacterized protein LOC110448285 [Mizuhopecten yessoensis]|uniref:Uncharacterized protein n=1 Tax=Mizuhopecten yessoensis TaxID=6573 RepID=A0A210QTJ4_MIZYE|nr:uncharacterized protein LOC110448285 [Mizuhopecten yessoensis]OWF52045.1 hypothetical protein KP79_PYT00652 [Mizuhopecten yessoensis]